jgi:signal transduction histidine kinase
MSSETSPELVERLAAHRLLGNAPLAELEWLAAHGTLRRLGTGDILTPKGGPVMGMFIILSGTLAIFVDRGSGRQKLLEWRGGDVAGLLPYSRLLSPPGDSVAQEPVEILALGPEDLPPLIHDCPEVTSTLVHAMLDRSRVFTSSGLHDEKMASLGKLSAGLAHELNNPVSAIERGASLLEGRLEEAEQATRALGASRLTDAQLAAIDAVRTFCVDGQEPAALSPVQQAEREEAIADWLADHGVDDTLSGPLADTPVTIDALDRIASAVDGPGRAAALRSVAAACAVRGIAGEMQEAAKRISGLVAAIKGFTHMDQAVVAAPVDLAKGLGDTVKMLNTKAKGKSVTVSIATAPDLPFVRGFGGELNQIWNNLIDNALDAAPAGGQVDVSAGVEHERVVVRVIDNGGGIPADKQARIFDPFFTTKPVGKGTGLGLDIVRRLVAHNEAGIDVESHPGRTEFRVSLAIADGPGGNGPS